MLPPSCGSLADASANPIDYQGSLRLDATTAQERIVRTNPAHDGKLWDGICPRPSCMWAPFAGAGRTAKTGALTAPAYGYDNQISAYT
ncbi:hypothetical protein D3Z36_13550 [Lachnospiraceae bacterium]|nr:hypothetical protein [Lachnospiraceae bacterium]